MPTLALLLVLLAEYPPGTWDRIIEGEQLVGQELDVRDQQNVLIINCSIVDSPRHGIFLRNVSNVWIESSTISGATQEGIDLSSSGSCVDVTIRHNTIHHVGYSGVHSVQPPGQATSFHPGLRVLSNTIHHTGLDTNPIAYAKLHGIYLQTSDYLIEGNRIHDSTNGHGISVRAAGIIRNNRVWGSMKASIRYYSDHPAGGDQVLLENNMVDEETLVLPFAVGLSVDPANGSFAVEKYIVRFNTIVVRGAGIRSLQVDPALSNQQVEVYGNLLVNANQTYWDGPIDNEEANFTTGSNAGFIDGASPPNDLHLTPEHAAVGFASSLAECPPADIDGDPRTCPGDLDPGADQLVRSKPDAGLRDSGLQDSGLQDSGSQDAASSTTRSGSKQEGCSCTGARDAPKRNAGWISVFVARD